MNGTIKDKPRPTIFRLLASNPSFRETNHCGGSIRAGSLASPSRVRVSSGYLQHLYVHLHLFNHSCGARGTSIMNYSSPDAADLHGKFPICAQIARSGVRGQTRSHSNGDWPCRACTRAALENSRPLKSERVKAVDFPKTIRKLLSTPTHTHTRVFGKRKFVGTAFFFTLSQ